MLVFGTNQRLAKIPKNLGVLYKHHVNICTTSFKYRGVELISPQNLNSHFDRDYKKVSSLIKSLHRLSHPLTNKSICSLLKLSFSKIQVKKCKSLERISNALMNNFDPNIINLLKKRVYFFCVWRYQWKDFPTSEWLLWTKSFKTRYEK